MIPKPRLTSPNTCIVNLAAIFMTLAILSGVQSASGEEAETQDPDPVSPSVLADSLRLDDLLMLAFERSPRVLAARDRWRAAQHVPRQRGSLPDPVLTYSHFIENVETRVGPQENVLSLGQKIPWPGKLGDMAAAAREESRAAEMDYALASHQVRMEVSETYYDLRWLESALGVLREEVDLLSRMEDVARVKYSTGDTGQQDVLKVQVEQANLERRILDMKQMAVATRARLLENLDLDATTELGPTTQDPPRRDPADMDTLLDLGLENRPEIGSMVHRHRSSQELLALARKAYIPDLTVMVNYVQVGAPIMPGVSDAGKDAVSIGASINLPIWLGRIRAGIREAEAKTSASGKSVAGAMAQLRAQVQDALFKVRTSLETTRLYETSILPQAEQTFFATQAAYQTGSVDFLTYLDSERALLNLKIAYQRALSDLGRTYAGLERAVGVRLEKILASP
jgi:cobalt-zinc-cadmium efflux system outer membrane protein